MEPETLLVFDDHLTSVAAVMFTSDELQRVLGAYDAFALMAVVDHVTGPSTGFKVKLYHSADGRNWLPKNGSDTAAEIGGTAGITLSGSGQAAFIGSDDGSKPTLALAKIKIDLGSSSVAHVRLYVTCRMRGRP